MTIDLTGPVPRVVPTCDKCGRQTSSTGQSELYRLIGSSVALCRTCFARKHG